MYKYLILIVSLILTPLAAPLAASVSANESITVTSPASTSGSVGLAITDTQGNSWTLQSSGVVYLNGVATSSAGGIELLYYDGSIYVEVNNNTSEPWWIWNGSAWVANANGDPRPVLSLTCTTPNTLAYNALSGTAVSTCTLTGVVSPIIWTPISDTSFVLSVPVNNVINVLVGANGIATADQGITNKITITAIQN